MNAQPADEDLHARKRRALRTGEGGGENAVWRSRNPASFRCFLADIVPRN